MSERMKIKNVVMTIAAKEIIYTHAQRFFSFSKCASVIGSCFVFCCCCFLFLSPFTEVIIP